MTVAADVARSENRLLFLLLAFGNFVIGMGAFVVVGIVTPIAEGLGIDKSAAGLTLTIYAAAYAIGSPLAVAATGNMARRTVLLLAMALFLAGSALSALSPSLTLLCLSRIIVALGAAIFTPVAASVAVALSAPEERGKSLSLVFGGLTLAQVAGVPLGAWLAYRHGWASAFWASAALAVAGLAALHLRMPAAVPFQGASLAAIASTLRDLRTAIAIAFTATFIAAIYLVFTFFGPLFEASLGTGAEIRTAYLVLFGIGAVIGNFAGGYLTDRVGSVRTLALLCLGQAAIMPLFSVIPWDAAALAVIVGVWSAFGWSFMAPQQARLVALAPRSQALVLALNAAMLYVGIAAGSGISAAVMNHFGLAALGIAGGFGALLALAHLSLSRALSPPAKS
jgi:MFS transporter, DHA1 family, inner membrane transport protein